MNTEYALLEFSGSSRLPLTFGLVWLLQYWRLNLEAGIHYTYSPLLNCIPQALKLFNKKGLCGYNDGSVGKVMAKQARGPEFKSTAACLMMKGGGRRMPRAHGHLTKLINELQVRWRTLSQKKKKIEQTPVKEDRSYQLLANNTHLYPSPSTQS